jgi:hypothetical protein
MLASEVFSIIWEFNYLFSQIVEDNPPPALIMFARARPKLIIDFSGARTFP